MTALQEETVCPLSFAQERMWLLDQIDPGAATCNLFHTVDISGPLAPALLARSLDEVVRRHQILRTTFAAPGGAPEPVVASAARRPLPLVDLAGLPEPSWRPEVARLSTEERRRPFDLAAEPLFRVALVRLSAGRHAGLLTAHPIVFDGGSSLVLWREVAALYEAFAAGRPSPLPELPLQYADHALWQRLHLAGDTLAGEVDPWRRALAPPLPVLRVPADFDRASAHGFLAGEVYRVLPAPLVAALRELGGRCGAPLSSTLLAAWAAVLGRTGGEEDLLVGTPIESRRPEAEGLIGPFRNTLVLRARPRLDRGYGPLVDEVRETAAAAAAHQDLPLKMLLTALGLPRDPRRAPPFQVMFLVRSQRSQPAPQLSFAGLQIAVSPPDPAADLAGEVFELGLLAEERSDPGGEGDGDGGIGLRLAYDALLFTEATAARLLDHLAAFLAAALAAPERPLAELPLLSTSERRQLLAWSDAGDGGEAGQAGVQPPLVHHAFFAQAARTPGAPAVVAEGAGGAEGREVSYGELARLARGLARRLVAQGIGPESRVAIALERSPRMVAAVFAVLTAGGAYVPLDPASPVERLAVILKDIGRGAVAAALLTGGGHAAACEAAKLAGLPVVDLDEIWPALEAEPAPVGEPASDPTIDPTLGAGREDLAYVIYTSGSTGAPKGVMIRHGGLASYVLATRRDLALTPSDRVLQFASLSFDASAEEIFCCLASGAALILRNDAMLAGAPAFLGTCASWGVTVCDLPTVFWQELVDRVDAGEAAWPPSLRLLVFGGERALPERVARLRRQLGPAARVINSYGPTEVTVAATSHAVHGEPDGPPRPLRELPIGRPLPGARAYVLDGTRELCPPGIPGEIAIGGETLARGYLGRPDLTASTFLPDPFAGRSGARMYTTGDVARHRLDGGEEGALEYLGRIDRQVKLRGFRIELAEIEGVLAQHPAVAEAAVGIDERRAGERALVAWWAARPGEVATAAELRGFLKERLPEPAVPSLFALLPALPRNASGKVDRRALPIPKLEAASAGGYEAPATPAEEAVAYVWRDVLGVPRVGRKDDFFALGGRSLLLPRVRHRLEQELGVRLSLASLLERTTAAALALAAEELLLDELERELAAAREERWTT
ncbi:MAG TPA: amino acid adenylation domain-containing protein [Thermoanaerobaculia bacterium]|nr:amino acid adenylation domain-containing protein [Thermoanaerobaculia bacterium]